MFCISKAYSPSILDVNQYSSHKAVTVGRGSGLRNQSFDVASKGIRGEEGKGVRVNNNQAPLFQGQTNRTELMIREASDG